jgi:DNA-binding HxlR family transcriptional regulator
MNKAASVSPLDCPGREVFLHLTSKWGFSLLIALSEGPMRFHTLRDALEGVSEKVLTQTLRDLARDGLIDRTVRNTVPPQVTYSLTELGQEGARRLQDLSLWIGRNLDSFIASRVSLGDEVAS